MAPLIHSRILLLGSAPTFVAATWPSRKIIRVGMPRTPYLVGVVGFSSTLSLAMVILPPSSPASSSRAGPICLQGPHHSAQKSTSTGFDEPSTSVWKEESVTLVVAMAGPLGTGEPVSIAVPSI